MVTYLAAWFVGSLHGVGVVITLNTLMQAPKFNAGPVHLSYILFQALQDASASSAIHRASLNLSVGTYEVMDII
ncbi:hypothetical protein CPC08DRAFT_710241 [Agrocybe pediades]|nr:hypothetical protein CPC08DRAFT_710241 [Agrocybe pediades]